jgi:hypothetical protein
MNEEILTEAGDSLNVSAIFFFIAFALCLRISVAKR